MRILLNGRPLSGVLGVRWLPAATRLRRFSVVRGKVTDHSTIDVKVDPEGVCRIVNGDPGEVYLVTKEVLESLLTETYAMAMCEEAPE